MLRIVLTIVILLLVLSFFGISLQHVVESPAAQSNFAYVGNLLEDIWSDIVTQVTNAWSSVF